MNRFIINISCILFLFFQSCKKEADAPGSASLTIINAIPGSGEFVTNFKSDGTVNYRNATKLSYKLWLKSDNQFEAYTGPQRLRLFRMPDTLGKDKPVYDLNLNLSVGDVYTMFLTGTLANPDTLMTRDKIHFFPAGDSAMAIRFVNLLYGSLPVSINIKGLPNGSEVNNLAYKQLSGFGKYAVSLSRPDYVFEFRDAASGNLVASYTTLGLNQTAPNNWVFRSFTIALTGIPGGTGATAPSAFLVGHY